MGSSAESEVSPDLVFELLSNQRRRMVLYYLRRAEGTMSVKELAREIAARENDVPVEELTSQQRKRVYVSLYQTHLPKLESTGMIDYDDEGNVRLTDRATEMDSYLTPPVESTYPWQYHYLVLALVGAALVLLSLFEAPVVSAIPVEWLAVGLTAAFVISTGVHYWQYRSQRDRVPEELVHGER